MSLIVNHVTQSSIQINYSYLESIELFGYTVTANYKINIADILFDNQNGVLLNGRSAIRQAYERQNITARIGADEFNNALITNLSFSEGSLVGSEVVDITLVESKRLNDYTSKTFAKYIPNPHLLDDFQETYSFNRNGSTYSYNRDISLKYSQETSNEFLNNAKVFLTNYYFSNRPSFGYYEDGISENAKFNERYYGKLNESIDLINLSVSLQESFDSSFIDNANDVSKHILQKIQIDDKGYLNKTLTVDLTSLVLNSQNALEQAMADVIDSIISEEEAQFGKPHSIQKGISKDAAKAQITISFSTNPSLSQENLITYSCDKQKAGSYVEYILNVNYQANGKNLKNRYDNTIALWNSLKDSNEVKVEGLFVEASDIYEKSRNANISKSTAQVKETITYTDNDAYDNSSLPDGILKYDVVVSKNPKIPRTSKILDVTSLREKLVVSNLDALGQGTVTATAISIPTFGLLYSKDFLNSKTSEMNSGLSETGYYATSDESTIDLSNGTANRVINYIIA